jgi:cysteinyl-tRNA synthetase
MSDIYLTNSLTRKKEKFVPINPPNVGVYSCGPTVYWEQHIGHMYAYVQWDVLVRLLKYSGYQVRWVMNITDVGHMTSEEDTGEDKMEKGAKREGISVWELSEKYTQQFLDSLDALNIKKPDVLSKVTDCIQDQINLIQKIEEKGFTYKTRMGVVYDTEKFKDYAKFANLKLKKLQKRKDLEDDPEKKKPWDFFLWVTGNPKHIMQWDSPWGKGYPGWHIECTAISTKYLGRKFDIHTGGIEHIPVHHTNEIAQGYAAFGSQTANYWLHNAWLISKGGEKMSKSLGNFVTVQDLAKKGYDPLSLRYLILTSHYRKGLNFSFQSLESAQSALNNLREHVRAVRGQTQRTVLSDEKRKKVEEYSRRFQQSVSDDLNIPQALATLWEALKSNIPSEDKYDLAISFDEVFGLDLARVESLPKQSSGELEIEEGVKALVEEREKLRKLGKFEEADEIRKKIESKKYIIEDTPKGPRVKKGNLSTQNEK